MKRGTRKQLFERRKDMLDFHRSGMKAADWTPLVATRHEVSEDAIKKDWAKRREWIEYFIRIDDAESLGKQLLQEYELAILDAENLYEQAEDTKIKTQILWLRLKSIKLKQNFLKEVGGLKELRATYDEHMYDHRKELENRRYPELRGEKNPLRRDMILRNKLTSG